MPTNLKKPITTDAKKLGMRLRSLRLAKGHTSQERFAFENDLSRVLYNNWETGRGNITYRNLVKVTRALDVTLKEFFSEGF